MYYLLKIESQRRESTEMTSRITTNPGSVCQIYLTLPRPSAFLELLNLVPPRRIYEIWNNADLFIASWIPVGIRQSVYRYRAFRLTRQSFYLPQAYIQQFVYLMWNKQEINSPLNGLSKDTRSSVSHTDGDVVLLEKGYHRFFPQNIGDVYTD